MSGPNQTEDLIHGFAMSVFAVLVLVGLVVLLSGSKAAYPPQQVSPDGITTATGAASTSTR